MRLTNLEVNFEINNPPISIAEIGVNHNGSIEQAYALIRSATKSGANIIKFQAFIAEEEISKFASKAEYQINTTGAEGSQLEMAKKLELSQPDLKLVRDYCRDLNVPFLCSAFEEKSLRFLVNDLRLKAVKIASSEVSNHPFLGEVGKAGISCILSTGASTLNEVGEAINVLRTSGCPEIILMHCLSNYPAAISEVNLKAISKMQETFGLPVGYSDHTEGVIAAMLAVSMGAVCVEKHFTLDKGMDGPDHRASAEPDEFRQMVENMKIAYYALGDGVKRVMDSEKANRELIRKSIVIRRDVLKGHQITEQDIACKRPRGGIEPRDTNAVIGRFLKRDMFADEQLKWSDLV